VPRLKSKALKAGLIKSVHMNVNEYIIFDIEHWQFIHLVLFRRNRASIVYR
jgi:hypothetical protein